MRHEWGPVRLTVEDMIATLEFNDPDRRNPISPAMVAGLLDAVDWLEGNAQAVRCLVVTGVGKAFSSGGDMAASDEIASARAAGDRNVGRNYTLEAHHHPVLRALREAPFPVISAVNGPAVGMGLGYALNADLILAARSARLVAGFVKVGMSPDAGTSWILPRLIGAARSREMMMLGDSVSAEQALAWGLVNRVFDDATFRDDVQAIARRLADGPPLALAAIRRLGWRSLEMGHEALIDEEQRVQRRLGGTADAAEGFRAFLEKRAPVFTGT